MNVFAYGVLQFPEILAAVTGTRPSHAAATLPGHRRERVRGAVYPGVVPDASAEVPGRLFRDVPRGALRFLDAFEGPEYVRRVCTVHPAGGEGTPAAVYVMAPDQARRLEGRPWDPDAFRDRHLASYLVRCRRLRMDYRAGRLDPAARTR